MSRWVRVGDDRPTARSRVFALFAGVVFLAVLLTPSRRDAGEVALAGNAVQLGLNLRLPMTPLEKLQRKAEREHQEAVEKREKLKEVNGALRFLPPLPYFGEDVVFSGHLVPDSDTIASSVAAAFLWNGTAMYAGKLNRESLYLLDRWQVEPPLRLEESYRGQHFVLVDHNAFIQRPKIFNATKIMGILDHHALDSNPTLVPEPVFLDIRPWGSCATVIATKYLEHFKWLPPQIAGLLLGGLLSDTLNLKSPITTLWDRKMSVWLAELAFWHDSNGRLKLGREIPREELLYLIDDLAHNQFRAKANLTGMSVRDILLSDFKTYKLKRGTGASTKVLEAGWGTIETVEPFFDEYLSSKLSIFVQGMVSLRKSKELEALFISVVDMERKKSVVLCVRPEDCALLGKSFPGIKAKPVPGSAFAQQLITTPRVSRKHDFLPPLRKGVSGLSG